MRKTLLVLIIGLVLWSCAKEEFETYTYDGTVFLYSGEESSRLENLDESLLTPLEGMEIAVTSYKCGYGTCSIKDAYLATTTSDASGYYSIELPTNDDLWYQVDPISSDSYRNSIYRLPIDTLQGNVIREDFVIMARPSN